MACRLFDANDDTDGWVNGVIVNWRIYVSLGLIVLRHFVKYFSNI